MVNLLKIDSAIGAVIFIPIHKTTGGKDDGDTNELGGLGRQSQGRERDNEGGAQCL
jgi:hypothetical protein